MSITIEELSVIYRDGGHALLALDKVSLELKPGRVTALVGESGSGKTTLGKALMGLLPENADVSGRICLDGRELTGLNEAALNGLRWSRIAMVFQNGQANLNPVYTVAAQVAEPLVQHRGLDRKTALKAAEEALVRMGLPPEAGCRYPHELSGGQVQRALLAMAMILDPEVLILDEPTAALDAMTKTFAGGLVAGLRDRGKAILLITHDLDVARTWSDDAAVLYLGQVMETMPGRDLLLHPEHPYSLALARSYPGMDAVRDLGGIRGDAFYRVIHSHSLEDGAGHRHSHAVGPEDVHGEGHAPPEGCLFVPRCTQALPECRVGEVDMRECGGHRVRCLRGGIVDLLRLEGVAKSYGEVAALKPTSLTLRAGELFCLVGETGSGKTTLAMVAAGALEPDRGRRVFLDRDMDEWARRDYPSLARRIGLIYQNPAEAVSHRFSVFDVVAEPLIIQKSVRDQQEIRTRVLKALADVRLSTEPEFTRRYPHELNMGAVQRLCIARALVHEPVLMVADEPTSSLDPSVQAKVLKTLLNLQTEKGLTMLFVTHDLGLARKIADRIGVMLAGRLVEAGPAAEVISRPGHPYTRQLLAGARGESNAFTMNITGTPKTGCPFSHRCGRVVDECLAGLPGAVNLNSGRHLAWCFNPVARMGTLKTGGSSNVEKFLAALPSEKGDCHG